MVLPLLASLAALGFASGSATAPSPCLASNFTVDPTGPISEPTGQHTLTFRFRYHGSRPCSLYGYPSVAFYDRRGKIPFAIWHRGDQVVTSRKPTRVVVGPRKAAFVVVNKYRCDLGEVRAALTLRLGFPRARPRERFAIAVRPRGWIAYCGLGDPGSGVTVSPFEPSLALAMRG
jgi:Domain of unknown function (DUF4232)